MQDNKFIRGALLPVLLAVACLLNPATGYANELAINLDGEGLVVESLQPHARNNPFRNLQMSPGDSKSMELAIENTRSHAFFLTVEAGSLLEDSGPSLMDGLWITVSEGEDVLGEFPARGGSYTFPDQFVPGSRRNVVLKVWLPCDAGNEYQTLKADFHWTFTAQSEPPAPDVEPPKRTPNGTGHVLSPKGHGSGTQDQWDGEGNPPAWQSETPYTGGVPVWLMLFGGILLIGAGLLLAKNALPRACKQLVTENDCGEHLPVVSDKFCKLKGKTV